MTAIMRPAATFDAALSGEMTQLRCSRGDLWSLPVRRWQRRADEADTALLSECVGSTLDLGCGPGRLAAALTERGVPVLGVDESPIAVELTRQRGALALRRNLFEPLPGEGRWSTSLLADGNIGIGGDPAALLRRVRALLARRGRAVVELDPPGSGLRTRTVRLAGGDHLGEWFRWSWVGVDAISELADSQGFSVVKVWTRSGRWFARLDVRSKAGLP
jgi:SAM-dependent methyltransferase